MKLLFQVVSIGENGFQELLAQFEGDPSQFPSLLSLAEFELIHHRKLIDEVSRSLEISVVFSTAQDKVSYLSEEEKLKSWHNENFSTPYVQHQPRVVEAEIVKSTGLGSKAKVVCLFDTGYKEVVVDYFEDELSFYPSEFVGLTKEGCFDLFRKKDIAYLQS